METATKNESLKRNPLPEKSEWLRAEVSSRAIAVDREANVLRGMVIAQEGTFKTEGRGAFDLKALKQMKAMINKMPLGLKSNFGHPNDSGDRASEPGWHLGRVKSPFIDVLRLKRDGEEVLVNALRGDLHLDKTALEEPPQGGKPRGVYLMDLAESDPDALSSSLQIKPTKVEQTDDKGNPAMDQTTGQPLPPFWYPEELHASDVVNTGDAVDGILSSEDLGDNVIRQATALLNRQFPNATREVIHARCVSFLNRALDNRFGKVESDETPAPAATPPPKVATLAKGPAELRTILAERRALG